MAQIARLRIYADTSVFGMVHPLAPARFRVPAERFFNSVRGDVYHLVTSEVVRKEIYHPNTPWPVKELFDEMVIRSTEFLVSTPETEVLKDAYIAAGILRAEYDIDALHVAVASVAAVDILTSWDRGEIVKPSRIAAFNAVNARSGYPEISILLPTDL